MPTQTDAKLSTEARNKLSESAFCGPGRSFPAHDKAHVTAGLRLLNRSNFSDATKAKIKACLYRKGKRYGIVPTQDELQLDPDILVRGVDDEWTPEQKVELETFFKDNPDADLPESTETTEQAPEATPVATEVPKIEDMKKPELVTLANALQKEVEDLKKAAVDTVAANDTKIAELNKKIEDAALLATQKEDEINKFLDENAILNKKLRDSIVSNIIDLKMTDNNNEERIALTEKYTKRTIESLMDTLVDLRNKPEITNSDTRVANTTIQTEDKNSDKSQNTNDEKPVDKFSLFDRDRSSTEEN